ncbi:hypothetical protein MRGA423_05780 [Mycobacterium tuberculosis RGTB423]|nr:hypothetical protein MRGA423_05780 [Mycobacterium tuberculosis RGTB423]
MSGYSAPRRISDADDVTSFSSGEPSLDDYLRKRALANHVQGGSRCFVTCRDGRVVGFYALASGSVAHADAPGRVRRNMPDPVPVILLSRLAVDRKEQGRGLGCDLSCVMRSVAVSRLRTRSGCGRFLFMRCTMRPARSTSTSTSRSRRPIRCT